MSSLPNLDSRPGSGRTELVLPPRIALVYQEVPHHGVKMFDPKAVQGSGNVLLYNGCAFSPVHSRNSIVVPFGCREVWRIVGNFGKQAIWM